MVERQGRFRERGGLQRGQIGEADVCGSCPHTRQDSAQGRRGADDGGREGAPMTVGRFPHLRSGFGNRLLGGRLFRQHAGSEGSRRYQACTGRCRTGIAVRVCRCAGREGGRKRGRNSLVCEYGRRIPCRVCRMCAEMTREGFAGNTVSSGLVLGKGSRHLRGDGTCYRYRRHGCVHGQ